MVEYGCGATPGRRPLMPAVDEDTLQQFQDKAVADAAAAMSAVLVRLGDRLGLYRKLAEIGPTTPGELARQTGTAERYVREWLANQAAGGFVTYDAHTETFSLSPEQAAALTDEHNPACVLGEYEVVEALFADSARLERAFRTGEGIDWGERSPCLHEGAERADRAVVEAPLVEAWTPAVSGVERQ